MHSRQWESVHYFLLFMVGFIFTLGFGLGFLTGLLTTGSGTP